jgi:hypothetical protein
MDTEKPPLRAEAGDGDVRAKRLFLKVFPVLATVMTKRPLTTLRL